MDSRCKSLEGVEGNALSEMVQRWPPDSGMSEGRVTCPSGEMRSSLETRPACPACPYRTEEVSDSPEEGAAWALEEPDPGLEKGQLVVTDPDCS